MLLLKAAHVWFPSRVGDRSHRSPCGGRAAREPGLDVLARRHM